MSGRLAALAAAGALLVVTVVASPLGGAPRPSPALAEPTSAPAPWPDCRLAIERSGAAARDVRATHALEVSTRTQTDLDATTALLATTLVSTTGERLDLRAVTNRSERQLLRCHVELGSAADAVELTFLSARTYLVSLRAEAVLAAIALHANGVTVRLADVASVEESTWTKLVHRGTPVDAEVEQQPSAPAPRVPPAPPEEPREPERRGHILETTRELVAPVVSAPRAGQGDVSRGT